MREKIRKWWALQSGHIVIGLTVLSVGCAGYMLGMTRDMVVNSHPMRVVMGQGVNTTLCDAQCSSIGIREVSAGRSMEESKVQVSGEGSVVADGECVLVGSKSGTKYYPPSCKAVKRIKSENLRCFTSEADARSQGYAKTKVCS